MTADPPRLSCRGLALSVAGRLLVPGLDLDVRAGECWVVIGPNGAGKTTLMNALAGLRATQAGAIASFTDLRAGSPVVHEDHGIARFTGFETKTVGGVTRDYLEL